MNIANLGVALVISFVFSWSISLVLLGFIPLIIIGGAFNTKMLAGFASKDSKIIEEAGKVMNTKS